MLWSSRHESGLEQAAALEAPQYSRCVGRMLCLAEANKKCSAFPSVVDVPEVPEVETWGAPAKSGSSLEGEAGNTPLIGCK
jgi:hypothetical protein